MIVSLFRKSGLILVLLLLLAGCNSQRGQDLNTIPTQAEFDPLATAQYLTQNAPPPEYRGAVAFPEVDANLNRLSGWRYLVQLEFAGVFAGTTEETFANATAEVWFNQLGSARRVLVETTGELLGREDNAFEAVRLGPDAFLVRDGVCLGTAGDDAATAADLRAGLLVGGANSAQPTGLRATINGRDAWQYRFTAADLNLPAIKLVDEGFMTLEGGEMWVSPEDNAVIRFYVNLNVSNAVIFDRQLPVTGQVLLRYDLFDIGVVPNITVPFGC
ncbi:MAG: hypothetical protein H6672_13980 [Anaerolineaceae bacterium]|nr:hypothetical protein [Anaerolineaceae bacterium]